MSSKKNHEKLYQFLRNHVAKGDTFTHTSISSPPGRYNIPDCDLDEFENLYYEAVFKNNASMYLTEAPSTYSPIKIDLDFRYISSDLERRYTIKQIKELVMIYMKEFEEWFYDLEPIQRTVCIFEKKSPRFKDGKDDDKKERIIKDGIHIMWPWITTNWTLQEIVRKHICSSIGNLLDNMQLTNTIYDVIDKQVIYKNNWQLYGSRKPNCTAYMLTHMWTCMNDTCTDVNVEEFLEKNGGVRWFISQLRIKRDISECIPIKESKQDEFEEQDKVMQIQTQVKQKINKTYELTGPSTASSEDIKLAKELVAILDKKRASSYKTWIELGWCLHNIHNETDELLQVWIDFSKLDPQYIDTAEEDCTKQWNHAHDGGLAMGTLLLWAKEDSPKKYFEVRSKQITPQVTKVLKQFLDNEIANLMKILYENHYVCSNYSKKLWYHFDGTRWMTSDGGIDLKQKISSELYKIFLDNINRMEEKALAENGIEGLDRKREETKHYRKKLDSLKKNAFKSSLMNECSELFYKRSDDFLENLDMNLDLVGFENGIYELDTGIFRQGRPEDYITMSTKINYREFTMDDPEIKEVLDFFSKIYTNERVREYMLTLLSSFLSGSVKEEKFHIWTGSGANGKSKMVELVQSAFGDYYGTLPITLLTQKRADCIAANPHMSRTKGKRFLVLQEPDTKTQLNVGLMKEITGGDTLTARPLYEQPFEFKPQFKCAIVANDIPAINPDDEAVWRRLRVAQHESKFVHNPDPSNPKEFKRDNELGKKLKKWAEPFVWLLLQYYKKYLLEGIEEPEEVTKYTQEYQRVQDHIAQFIQDRIEYTENQFDVIRLHETFDEYKQWAKDSFSKFTPKNKAEFKVLIDKKLNSNFFNPRRLKQKTKTNPSKAGAAANGWYGYKLITKFEIMRREMEEDEELERQQEQL